MYHVNSASLFIKKKILLSLASHITYQKANNIVLKFVEEDAQNIDLLQSALRDHLRTIQYVYSLLFPKIYNRTNRFGKNNKSHFDFNFINWRHCKSNLVLPTPTRNKVGEKPIRKIIPEIEEKKKFYALEKDLKATKKESLIPLSKTRKK